MAEDPYARFRILLDKNTQFPSTYTHKIVGKNSKIFADSVVEFEKKFIGLKRIGEKQSASGAHISLTYEYIASSAEDVVQLTIETQKINDIIYIL